ncbi:MAG TPA: HEAT repeat domain-containing protein [Planctomycetota bacterium]|nr:HEAT repeat domain-containing protein [Planctomycetota bacterium]
MVTARGTVRLPAVSVVADFVTWPEARRQCESRLAEATKLFEEASAKPERDATRRRELVVSLDICAETRDLLEILEKRAPAAERDSIAGLKGKLFQFMRLVRDAKGATALSDGPTEAPFEKVSIEELGLTAEVLPESAKAVEITGTLGQGQFSALADLESESAAARGTAARRLISPPAPFALSALAKALQVEKERDPMLLIAGALSQLDLGPRLKTNFAWAVADEDVARRYVVLGLARRIHTKGSCEFLGDCFRTKPPSDHRMRAAFSSAFRKLRPFSIDVLREIMMKAKDKELQVEAVRQLGMMRDWAALPSFKVALGGSREVMTAAFNAIEKTGGVAIPLVMEMLADGNDEIRRLARVLAQRITREPIDGPAELQKWYAQYRRHIEDDEKSFWKAQEEADFPVAHEELRIYDRKLPGPKDP